MNPDYAVAVSTNIRGPSISGGSDIRRGLNFGGRRLEGLAQTAPDDLTSLRLHAI
jgi:hypothetical protein